jgi:LmbE family N-acetylglucosaminyl deacetylase
MAEIVETVPSRVLAVYAHPDDPEVAAAGTLARWASAGAEVALVICTEGDKGTSDPSTDPAELAERRALEVASAAATLGLASHEMIGVPDGEITNTAELRSELVARIRRHRPEVVIGPDPTAVFFGSHYVNHRDHRELGWALLDAVSPAAGSPHYFPEAGPAHRVSELYLSGSLEPDVWIDIADALAVKAAALRCHHSQLLAGADDWVDELVRRRAEEAGRAAGIRYAEGFRRLTVS